MCDGLLGSFKLCLSKLTVIIIIPVDINDSCEIFNKTFVSFSKNLYTNIKEKNNADFIYQIAIFNSFDNLNFKWHIYK